MIGGMLAMEGGWKAYTDSKQLMTSIYRRQVYFNLSRPRPGIIDLLIQFDLERAERLLDPNVPLPFETLLRPSNCTSVDCDLNIRTLRRETTKILSHVEKLEHLLKEKASATAEELDLVRQVRAEYARLGATQNATAIKDLAERLSTGHIIGSIEDSENQDVMDTNEPLVETEVTPDDQDANEPLVEREVTQLEVSAADYPPLSAAADSHYPPSHSPTQTLDTNSSPISSSGLGDSD